MSAPTGPEFKRLEVRLALAAGRPIRVGELADDGRRIIFEYDPEFMRGGLELSPHHLPLKRRAWSGGRELFEGLPGVIDDSLPDGWGRILMDRHFRAEGMRREEISPLDRLAYLGTRTMGALTYHPPQSSLADYRVLDLDMLEREAREVLSGDASEVLEELLRVGGSPGGARPKALVGLRGDEVIAGDGPLPDGFEPWIVKFMSTEDSREFGVVEYVYSRMAARAGLEMSACRLIETRGGKRFFATRRFDRDDDDGRVHVHTLSNFLHTSHRQPNLDYEHLLRVGLRLTRSHPEALRLYRLMLFNVLAWNRDDHGKNFSFVMTADGVWRASPAYDLTFARGARGYHWTTVGGEGRAPSRRNLDALADLLDLPRRARVELEAQAREAVAGWTALAREHGVSASLTDEIASYHARARRALDDGPGYR